MLLAIDIGNSATKVGREAADGGVEVVGCFPTPGGDAFAAVLEAAAGKGVGVSIASVVPKESDRLAQILDALSLPYRFLAARNAPGLEIRYETPETLGSDRIANAIALSNGGPVPAIAVDFGTAAKLEAIDAQGAYLGGAILPGPRLMVRALSFGTAQLPEVPVAAPERAIGRRTVEALQSGTVLALAKAVDGLIAEFERELGGPARTVGTGGQADVMRTRCSRIGQWEPHLTLRGLLIAGRRWRDAGWVLR